MAKSNPVKAYTIAGIVLASVLTVGAIGTGIWWLVSANKDITAEHVAETVIVENTTTEDALKKIDTDAAKLSDLRIAVVKMDEIQNEAKVLKALREQRKSYEEKLQKELTQKQKELEKEKAEIERSQDVLSREALERRILDYQKKVAGLQRELTERAQSVEENYQKALVEIQENHLNPVIEGIINKKDLSLVIDGRMVRIGDNAKNLDITDDVIKGLDKKVSKIKMKSPKGF